MRSSRPVSWVLVGVSGLLVALSSAGTARQAPGASPTVHLAGVPLYFEANVGQADARFSYLARGPGYTVGLAADGAVIRVRGADTRGTATIRMVFGGASSHAEPTALDRLTGTVNYLIGNDPARWQTRIPTYGQVRYREIIR